MLVAQKNKWWLAAGFMIALPLSAPGQNTSGKGAGPSFKDLEYDDEHESQKLDVYLATTDQPVPAMVFIHGGGWRAGSKKNVPHWLRKAVSDGWLSVVSVEYGESESPAPLIRLTGGLGKGGPA